MKKAKIKVLHNTILTLPPIFLMSNATAEETIIKKEEISYEKCLKVIGTSENKLSISPEITHISEQKSIAVFTLVDGTLTITCDGIEGYVTVSTNTDKNF